MIKSNQYHTQLSSVLTPDTICHNFKTCSNLPTRVGLIRMWNNIILKQYTKIANFLLKKIHTRCSNICKHAKLSNKKFTTGNFRRSSGLSCLVFTLYRSFSVVRVHTLVTRHCSHIMFRKVGVYTSITPARYSPIRRHNDSGCYLTNRSKNVWLVVSAVFSSVEQEHDKNRRSLFLQFWFLLWIQQIFNEVWIVNPTVLTKSTW